MRLRIRPKHIRVKREGEPRTREAVSNPMTIEDGFDGEAGAGRRPGAVARSLQWREARHVATTQGSVGDPKRLCRRGMRAWRPTWPWSEGNMNSPLGAIAPSGFPSPRHNRPPSDATASGTPGADGTTATAPRVIVRSSRRSSYATTGIIQRATNAGQPVRPTCRRSRGTPASRVARGFRAAARRRRCGASAAGGSRTAGRGRATELLLTGRLTTAEEAQHIGLVHRVVEPERLLAETEALLQEVVAQSSTAVSLTWEAMHRGLNLTLKESTLFGADYFGLVASSDEFRQRTTSFLKK
jgi:hypothetical protein